MANPLLQDELWKRIEPLLPQPKPRRIRLPRRKPIDDCKALTGIPFVLQVGFPLERPAPSDERRRHNELAASPRRAPGSGLGGVSLNSSSPNREAGIRSTGREP